jgi:predicted Rossmann fold flavoprotein
MAWDVVVVGAGAAGLFAAMRSAERGRRTLLLEKNNKLGVKILMSGGTRCNITHQTNARGIANAFGRNGSFLHSALAALSPERVVDLMNEWGVATKVESTGKVFPVSNRALDVRDALVNAAKSAGADIRPASGVRSIEIAPNGFNTITDRETIPSQSLILTVGGMSYPGCGTTGDGYAWAAHWGHTIVPPRPALTPLVTANGWMNELSGLTIDDVELTLKTKLAPYRQLDRRRGSFLFTHSGISGPVALDISGTITAQANVNDVRLFANFLPATSAHAFRDEWTSRCRADGKKHVTTVLGYWLAKSLAAALIRQVDIREDLPVAELSRSKTEQLFALIFALPIDVHGTKGFDKAEVTAGGVHLSEVDSRTMESKLVPRLFLAGEILDLDGPIGGYNFQSAFSTGWLAGDNA